MDTTPVETPSTSERWILRAANVVITCVVAGVFFVCAYVIAVNLCTYWYGETTTGVVIQARHSAKTTSGVGIRFEYRVAGDWYVGRDRVSTQARLGTGDKVAVRFLHLGPIKYAMCPDGRMWAPHMVLPCVFVLPAGWALFCLVFGGLAGKVLRRTSPIAKSASA